jgi:outer membrane receptor protein involved in Fe transport
MNRRRNLAVRPLALVALLALALGLALMPAAQAQATGANLIGRVADKNGAPLPGVTVTATQKDTGLTRSTVTESDGTYRLPSVPIGLYTVTAELNGFATVTVEEVRLNVASQREINIDMSPATLEETITVTAEAPLVETTPAIGTVVSEQQLENLPLNGRQFANLAILAPGTALAYNSDPTKPGQLTVALNGGIGRNVNFIMDGGDNTDDTIGGALQNFNLEAVEEFSIQTMQYKAEYGRSSGGVLSVVTKTGTNDFAGSVYGFFRDDNLNTETETEKLADAAAREDNDPATQPAGKQPYDRKQYGASLGGPIVRDKAHFFATYEKTDRETSSTIQTGGLFPSFDGIATALPFKDELITAKATYDVSAKQYLQVRYGYQKNNDKYGASPLAAPSSLGTVTNEYGSVLAGHTAQLGADMLNEFIFQFTKFDNTILPDSNDPFIYYPSGFHTGQNINTPQSTHQRKYQYKDDFSFSRTIGGDRHDFKVGANYIHEPELGGDFSTGLAGQYTAIDDRIGSPINLVEIFGGFFGEETPVDQYGGYLQDDWLVNDRLTINLGVRYDKWTGFDLDQRSNPIWQTFATQTRFNEFYLRDFQGGKGGVLENDDNNYAPRIGFTFDLKGDGRQLLRGGYGTYYDFPYTNATILFPAAAVQSNYGVVYRFSAGFDRNGNPLPILNSNGTPFQPGQPLPPNQLPGADVGIADEVASPTLATPYSDQASLGYSWQVNNWLGLNVEVVTVDYHDIPFRFRPNIGVDADHDGVFEPAAGETTRWPQFGNFRLWYGGGRASYDGVNLSARVRRDKFELQGFYTYSKSEGNVLAGADEFRLTDAGAQSDVGGSRSRRDQTINPLDPLCGRCFGPLYTDARHKVTLSGLYQGPWGINFSGMLRYHSAFPYMEHANADLNGDATTLDLRPGVSSVNTGRGDSFSQFDLRVSKEFTFGSNLGVEVIAEVFNVFNEKNASRPDRFGNPSAFAGDPLQGEQRLGQLGLRVRF